MSSPHRTSYLRYADALRHPRDFSNAAGEFFAADADINVVHPFNGMTGAAAYITTVLRPLQQAFDGLYQRCDIVMAGEFDGQSWISATGYYTGRFAQDWIGIKATGTLSYLRFGEFHRMDGDKAVESYIFLDIPELMIASGQWPLPTGPGLTRGYTGLIQGPASRDGVITQAPDPDEGTRSYQIVTDMLSGLATKDEAWRPYWHDNMMWYGPGAFGSFIGIDQFASFQVPFESQFEHWSGGSSNNGMTTHFTRYGEGNYTCSGGWPSLTGISVKPFLGQDPTGERVFMRVCDWWRREGDLLVENWVFVDVPHVLLQLGYDPLPK
ncbi:nuclear transport factor 2 family protein [Pseudooctadecabacter sp.]|uniref:nuclear transport factor 2 family protein n=1 Tax=Pseudooctadecabacter sp. TaxID=1966338 RepID=UPI0025E7EE73|nr:nuclear transport factor 2 family protein [Pseudooctadecabacter sp.]